jgi:hypothetical protein
MGRIYIKTDRSVTSFDVTDTLSTADAISSHRKVMLRIAKGHSRRIVSIDGPPSRKRYWFVHGSFMRIESPFPYWETTVWALRVARSYLVVWANVTHRATLGRHIVRAAMAELDGAQVTRIPPASIGEGK